MKFLQAVDRLQDGNCLGIYRDTHSNMIIYWNQKSRQFKNFYSDEPYLVSKSDLFADDWLKFMPHGEV